VRGIGGVYKCPRDIETICPSFDVEIPLSTYQKEVLTFAVAAEILLSITYVQVWKLVNTTEFDARTVSYRGLKQPLQKRNQTGDWNSLEF